MNKEENNQVDFERSLSFNVYHIYILRLGGRNFFTMGHFCTKDHFCTRTQLHGVTFARKVTFAQVKNLAQRHFCMKRHFCASVIFYGGSLLNEDTFAQVKTYLFFITLVYKFIYYVLLLPLTLTLGRYLFCPFLFLLLV